MLTLDQVYNAAAVLKDTIYETPLVKAEGFDVGCDLWLKLENLQKTGSYQIRGMHSVEEMDVIAGYGTLAPELDQEGIDAVIVPVIGGLIAGVAFALKALRPDIKVYGVTGAPDLYNAIRDEETEVFGEQAFRLINESVDDIALVTEDEIAAAMLTLMERQNVVADSAGAATVAAVMFEKFPIRGKKVISLISGGNIDVTRLPGILERGLVRLGRAADIFK